MYLYFTLKSTISIPVGLRELSQRFGKAMTSIVKDVVISVIYITTGITTPLAMKVIAFPKRRDNSPTSDGDIPEDIMDISIAPIWTVFLPQPYTVS
jgi:hypothetical protein